MNSNLAVYNVHMFLFDMDCVDEYKIRVDNNTQNVTVNVTYTDKTKKRILLEGGRGEAFSQRINKAIDSLVEYTEAKEKTLKDGQ